VLAGSEGLKREIRPGKRSEGYESIWSSSSEVALRRQGTGKKPSLYLRDINPHSILL